MLNLYNRRRPIRTAGLRGRKDASHQVAPQDTEEFLAWRKPKALDPGRTLYGVPAACWRLRTYGGLKREPDPPLELGEARVRVQRIEGRLYFDVRKPGIALLTCLFEPRESLIVVAKPHID